MTQFNLLPDVKLAYLKAEKDKHLVIAISAIVAIAAVFIAGVLFVLTAYQSTRLHQLNSDIASQSTTLSGHKKLQDILTIQNQIQTLNTLHQQEPQVSNLAGYLNQLLPTTASISSLSADFTANTITMNGNADSLATINKLVDSIKFATYSVKGLSGTTPAFSQIQLTSFGLSATGDSFAISFNFDPQLFNNTINVSLNVPSLYSTRSQIDQPTVLFTPQSTSGKTNG